MDDALDFWLGEWDCTFDGGRATNTITREHDGRVVVERFQVVAGEAFSGTSLSVHTPDGWRQTWADSAGGYWTFVGRPLDDGGFEFRTPGPVDAEQVIKRMVFSHITADGFDWRWEFSPDGCSWDVRWQIRYDRGRPR